MRAARSLGAIVADEGPRGVRNGNAGTRSADAMDEVRAAIICGRSARVRWIVLALSGHFAHLSRREGAKPGRDRVYFWISSPTSMHPLAVRTPLISLAVANWLLLSTIALRIAHMMPLQLVFSPPGLGRLRNTGPRISQDTPSMRQAMSRRIGVRGTIW